jgi:hypothetical protein
MRRLNLAALFGSVVVGMVAVGCGGGEDPAAGEPVVPPAEPIQLRSMLANKGDSRLVAAIRGPGQIGYLQPLSRRDGSDMVTTFRIKNISNGALAGFKVDEFWYDDAGDTVTGGTVRKREPFLMDEVIEVEMRIPRNSRMSRSNYEFSHQNGVVEANLFEEMEEPTPVEPVEGDEAAEETDAAETPAR